MGRINKETGLTVKQENFCNKYIECGVGAEAYRYAYTGNKMTDKQIIEEASKMLTKPNVAQRVKFLQSELKAKSDITKERVLNELAKIGFSSIAHLHNTWIELKDFELLTEEQKGAIKGISTKVDRKVLMAGGEPQVVEVAYVKIELHDKLKALETINKMMGFEAPLKTDNVIRDGFSHLNTDQLEKELERLRDAK